MRHVTHALSSHLLHIYRLMFSALRISFIVLFSHFVVVIQANSKIVNYQTIEPPKSSVTNLNFLNSEGSNKPDPWQGS